MHRAGQILNAAAAAVAGRATLGASVFKHLAATLSEDAQELPAIGVRLGDDDVLSDAGVTNLAFLDSAVTLRFKTYAVASDQEALGEELLRLRSEVHRALFADQTLGLPFVMGITYGGALEPETDDGASRFIGRQELAVRVLYRMNLTDPD